MTGYTAEELAQGWEFKIVRSATNAFRRPEFLAQVLAEEKRAGWVLVEKFDNGRIRLKRPASARASDSTAGGDAYRTHVGMSDLALALTILASVLGTMAIIVLLIVVAHQGG